MPDFCEASATNGNGTFLFSPYPAGYKESGTYQPIIPNWMPSLYPFGRFSLITLRTALSTARRSAGREARYSVTVVAVIQATIPRLSAVVQFGIGETRKNFKARKPEAVRAFTASFWFPGF